jgi:type II secretory pathway pseudopilin PulG
MKRATETGFTIVEVIVALVISTLLIIGIYSAVSSTLKISVGSSQRTTASNVAYANLREYANGRSVNWWTVPSGTCTATSTQQVFTSTAAIVGLPSPTTQTVTASVPYGCPAANATTVYRLESTVTYGSNNMKVTHAIFTTL